MRDVDVAIQSFRKPESLVYTVLSLWKHCGEHIDQIFIDDDCSGGEITKKYLDSSLLAKIYPIRINVRVNFKPSKFTYTIVTPDLFKKESFSNKARLISNVFINRIRFHKSNDDIRYQWAISQTNKKYLFIIHDDIKFFNDVLGLYLRRIQEKTNCIIVGDLGGSKRCPFGPCGEKDCCPQKILDGYRPCKEWPITGPSKFYHKLFGRLNRKCRINEWCCLLDVEKTRKFYDKTGFCFGNYEGGGDVGCFWFQEAIKSGFSFNDPLPNDNLRRGYYLHWWQGFEGHNVWVKKSGNLATYDSQMIIKKMKEEFNYDYK